MRNDRLFRALCCFKAAHMNMFLLVTSYLVQIGVYGCGNSHVQRKRNMLIWCLSMLVVNCSYCFFLEMMNKMMRVLYDWNPKSLRPDFLHETRLGFCFLLSACYWHCIIASPATTCHVPKPILTVSFIHPQYFVFISWIMFWSVLLVCFACTTLLQSHTTYHCLTRLEIETHRFI